MHLAKVDGSDALYRLAPGKVRKERIESLVYPIDIAYNHSEHAYELRTSAKDIFQSLFCKNYHFSKTVLHIINIKIPCVHGNARFISCVILQYKITIYREKRR